MLPRIHGLGVGMGSLLMLGAGGIFPVLRDWLNDEVHGPADVVARLGGPRIASLDRDMDVNFGPILARSDAPSFHDAIASISRRMTIRPPEEVRLAYLPCCGVLTRRRKRILLVGLPLLHVLTRGEFHAVLAHEMAHLARGDATRVMDSLRFLEALGNSLDDPHGGGWGLMRAWSSVCRHAGEAIATPVARGQEIRADRASGSIAGGSVAASALAKVALVQPLFREVLGRFAEDRPGRPNVFATFRAFWERLPTSFLDEMRHQLQVDRETSRNDPHPPLADRLASLQSFPDRPLSVTDQHPAWTLVNDLEWLEEMLHESLFRRSEARPNVFHRAGS